MYRGRIHNSLFSSQLTKWTNKPLLHYSRLEILVRDKHSSLFDQFITYEKMISCEYAPKFLSKLLVGCLSKPVKVTDMRVEQTLAYYKICPFSVNYKSVLFCSTGPCRVCPLTSLLSQSNICGQGKASWGGAPQGLNSGWLQPCPQIIDQGGSYRKGQTHQLNTVQN